MHARGCCRRWARRVRRASAAARRAGGRRRRAWICRYCRTWPRPASAGWSIVDHDRVEESNLHRQPLYRMSDLGEHKVRRGACGAARAESRRARSTAVARAARRCQRAAPGRRRGCGGRCRRQLRGDLRAERCLSAGRTAAGERLGAGSCPVTSAPSAAARPSYRAVFPELPRAAGSCAASGVLGTAVGVLGYAAGAPGARRCCSTGSPRCWHG